MPRLPETRRLTVDLIPAQFREWVLRGIVEPVNKLLQPLYAVLDRGLSVQTNLNAQVLQRDITVAGLDYTVFSSTLRGKCIGIVCLAAVTLDNAGKPTLTNHDTLGKPNWDEQPPAKAGQAPQLRIRNQSGLTPGARYRMTWLALGE